MLHISITNTYRRILRLSVWVHTAECYIQIRRDNYHISRYYHKIVWIFEPCSDWNLIHTIPAALKSGLKSNPLTNVKWHSDPWPTVTSLPIRLSTNFMTLIPSLTFTELWVVSMEHLQRVWLASRERLPFRTPGSVPHFGTCQCSNCWDQIPRTCHVFTRLFTSNTPWYFLDFTLKQ